MLQSQYHCTLDKVLIDSEYKKVELVVKNQGLLIFLFKCYGQCVLLAKLY